MKNRVLVILLTRLLSQYRVSRLYESASHVSSSNYKGLFDLCPLILMKWRCLFWVNPSSFDIWLSLTNICYSIYSPSSPEILQSSFPSIFSIFNFLRWSKFWIWYMWLCPRWRLIKLGTFSISHIYVKSFSSSDMRVTLFNGTFYFPLRVIPLSNTASLMDFGGNSFTSSGSSYIAYASLRFFIFFSISYFSMRSCSSCSLSLAAAKTSCMACSLNISFTPSYFAWALMATMITMHSSGEYFSSTSSLPFKKEIVSQSSKPLSIRSLTLSILRWSHSLSMRPYIGFPYII